MDKIKISEIFYSIQGEGLHVGVPSIFLRTFGCNFSCKNFGIDQPYEGENLEVIEALKSEYKDFKDLPLVSTGCDSYGSWHPKLKHLSPVLTIDAIVERILELLPFRRFRDEHLVITGGEPLLGWQKAYPELLEKLSDHGLEHVTFETNGTQSLETTFRQFIEHSDFNTTFSVSPKLSISGEKWEDAIKPEAVSSYEDLGENTYLKFVVSKDTDIEEIKKAVCRYHEFGFYGRIYLMPVGGEQNLYNLNNKAVAEIAMQNGWCYSPRLQVDLFKNNWGT